MTLAPTTKGTKSMRPAAVRFTEPDILLWRLAALASGLTPSEYARRAVRQAALQTIANRDDAAPAPLRAQRKAERRGL